MSLQRWKLATIFVAAAVLTSPVLAQVTLREPGANASKSAKAKAGANTGTDVRPVGRYLDTARLAPGETRKSANAVTQTAGGLAWDPTGRYLLQFNNSWGGGGSLTVLNAGSFAQVRQHAGHAGRVRSAVFTRNGLKALTASDDKTAQVWDVVRGTPEKVFTGHTKVVRSAAFDADETRVITASEDGSAIVWDRQTGQQLSALPGAGGRQKAVYAAFIGEGTRAVVVTDDSYYKIWNLADGSVAAEVRFATRATAFADLSPDRTTLVTSSADRTVRLIDLQSGNIETLSQAQGFQPARVKYSPDGKLIGVSGARSVLVLSVADRAPLDSYEVPQQSGFAALLSGGGGVEFTFSSDSLTLILGPVPEASGLTDPLTGAQTVVMKYVEWRPEI